MRIRPARPTHAEPVPAVIRKRVPHAFGPDEVVDYKAGISTISVRINGY